ncbi:hypothetical protein AB0J14_28480 [Micromonospora arborensis]|uniref:hypothetical protein n=1 Tax=Micromonospora arborensis TaxID=2116518 RepID=UPI003410C4DD
MPSPNSRANTGTAFARAGSLPWYDRKSAKVDVDAEVFGTIGGDHLVDGGGEVGAALPVGEQVDVFAGAVEDSVCGESRYAGARPDYLAEEIFISTIDAALAA